MKSDPIILKGAIDAAAGRRRGESLDDVLARQTQRLRKVPNIDNRDLVQALLGSSDVAEELADLRARGLISTEDLENFANDIADVEYGADQADFQTRLAEDKDITGRERRRAEQTIEDLIAEQQGRSDGPERAPSEFEKLRRNADPRKDGFVQKVKGKPVRSPFAVGDSNVQVEKMRRAGASEAQIQAYIADIKERAKNAAPQTDIYGRPVEVAQNIDNAGANDVLVAKMARTRKQKANDVEGLSEEFNDRYRDLKYDAEAKAFVEPERKPAPEQYYPAEYNNGPGRDELFGVGAGGRANDKGMISRIDAALASGEITDPAQVQQLQRLRSRFAERDNPALAIKADRREVAALRARANEPVSDAVAEERAARRVRLLEARDEPNSRFNEKYGQEGEPEFVTPKLQGVGPGGSQPAVSTDAREAVKASIIAGLQSKAPNAEAAANNQAFFEAEKSERIRAGGKDGARDNRRFRRIGNIVAGDAGIRADGKTDYIQEVPRGSVLDVANFPPAVKVFGDDTYIDGYDGRSLASDDYEYAVRRGMANEPVAGEMANAPTNMSLTDLVDQNLYNSRKSGEYPQVGIQAQLDKFAEQLRLRGGLSPDVNLNVRNIAEAEALLGQVVEEGLRSGNKFYRYADGKNNFVENPGVSEALQKLGYKPKGSADLLNALYQLDRAGSSGVNQQQKDVYLEGGDYIPQRPVGQETVDVRSTPVIRNNEVVGAIDRVNASVPGAVIPGKDYYQMNSPEQMADYMVGQDIAIDDTKVAPRFRELTGANMEGTPIEKKVALQDARRAFVGRIEGQDVPIAGKKGNPSYRFIGEDFAGMSKADIPLAIEMQERRRLKPGQELSPKRQEVMNRNINNALAVQERANAESPAPPTDTVGKEVQARKQAAIGHAQRSKPDFTPASIAGPETVAGLEQAKEKLRGMPPAQVGNQVFRGEAPVKREIPELNQEVAKRGGYRFEKPAQNKKPRNAIGTESDMRARIGLGASGIDTPPSPAPEPRPNYTVEDLGEPRDDISNFRPGDTKTGFAKRKAQAANIINTMKEPRYATRRRIGYGGAAAAGLIGLAGYTSGNGRQEQEVAR